MSFLFRGPARVELFSDTECVELSIPVSIAEVMPETFSMMIPLDCNGWQEASAVRVAADGGWARCGMITWKKAGTVIFRADLPGMDAAI
ncbi:hypothetical protein RAM80_07385 [Pseudomonas sp. App30]|uniref:hypothetical protein n=1 Tax=Pseudomonas sp. App30 TaxID=3068990 RepID=UPI003A813C61